MKREGLCFMFSHLFTSSDSGCSSSFPGTAMGKGMRGLLGSSSSGCPGKCNGNKRSNIIKNEYDAVPGSSFYDLERIEKSLLIAAWNMKFISLIDFPTDLLNKLCSFEKINRALCSCSQFAILF